jgi:hypothetical protein
MAETVGIPNTVRVYHTMSRASHIFTSPDLPALLVGHSDLHKAFELIPKMVCALVERQFHKREVYIADTSFEELSRKVTRHSSPNAKKLTGKELAAPDLTFVAKSLKSTTAAKHS